MRINGIRCDLCGKEHLFRPDYRAAHMLDTLEPGWFMVTQRSEQSVLEPWLFCSKECLCKHPLRREEER